MRAVLRAEDGNLYPDGERPNAPGAPRERRRFAWGLRHAARAVRRWYLAVIFTDRKSVV